jgi:hypothetical protein
MKITKTIIIPLLLVACIIARRKSKARSLRTHGVNELIQEVKTLNLVKGIIVERVERICNFLYNVEDGTLKLQVETKGKVCEWDTTSRPVRNLKFEEEYNTISFHGKGTKRSITMFFTRKVLRELSHWLNI